jgi:hypothetical protein
VRNLRRSRGMGRASGLRKEKRQTDCLEVAPDGHGARKGKPMNKQAITDKIIYFARRASETNDSQHLGRLCGRLEVLLEQLDALPAAEPAKPRLMICSGAKECKYPRGCQHRAPHKYMCGGACEALCGCDTVGVVTGAHCIPVEEVPA